MVSSPGDRTGAGASDRENPPDLNGSPTMPNTAAKSRAELTGQMDMELMFRLIDSILPFEACLYHQILPLSLEGSRLKLGMVNLDDSAALDYVRRILAYMNCSLVPQTLSSEVHHAVLSAYLNYAGTQKKAARPGSNARSVAKRIEEKLSQSTVARVTSQPDLPTSHANENSDTPTLTDVEHTDPTQGAIGSLNLKETSPDSTIVEQPHSLDEDQAVNPTLLVDSPAELSLQDQEIVSAHTPIAAASSETATRDTFVESAADRTDEQPSPSKAAEPKDSALRLETDRPVPFNHLPNIPAPSDALPILAVEPKHLLDPIDVLAKLQPAQLLKELLGRVLAGGIGRLYFERQQHNGRILWSQDGVPQSVLEHLPSDVVQGVINELKLLTRIPLLPVQKPKQVEIERIYQRHRLLLRLRVMPGNYGEEATLQVLRGAALKFYQQQQLTSLSRDALVIAQELQRKVNEISARTRFYPVVTSDQSSIFPAINSVIKNIEEQLDALKTLQTTKTTDTEEDG